MENQSDKDEEVDLFAIRSRSERRTALASLLWIPLSFLIPFLCINLLSSYPTGQVIVGSQAVEGSSTQGRLQPSSVRSGIVGTIAAFLVFFLWKIDSHPILGAERKKHVWETLLLVCFAILLWTFWTACGHIMLRANDETREYQSDFLLR